MTDYSEGLEVFFPTREEVDCFAERMEAALVNQDHLPHWRTRGLPALVNSLMRLSENIQLNVHAYINFDDAEVAGKMIRKQCVELAMFSLMIDDVCKDRKPKQERNYETDLR